MKIGLFFLAFLLTEFSVSSQDLNSGLSNRENVVKFLPGNIPFGSISFEYERMINDKNSVILGIGIPTNMSVNGKCGMDTSDELKNDHLGTTHIRAAYRHYAGKRKPPRGFYIEPYLKYQNLNGEGIVSGIDEDTDEPYSDEIDIKHSTFNLGFQLGTQFLIAKWISLDLYFFGLEAGFLNGNSSVLFDNPEDAADLKNDIDEVLADIPLAATKRITVTQSGNLVKVSAKNAFYPWYRGGISIGIAF